jgi:hypothetical protein
LKFDTFGDKPQCSALGNQSRKSEGLKRGFGKGLVALSVNPEDAKYSPSASSGSLAEVSRAKAREKQVPMLVIGVFRRVDIILSFVL